MPNPVPFMLLASLATLAALAMGVEAQSPSYTAKPSAASHGPDWRRGGIIFGYFFLALMACLVAYYFWELPKGKRCSLCTHCTQCTHCVQCVERKVHPVESP